MTTPEQQATPDDIESMSETPESYLERIGDPTDGVTAGPWVVWDGPAYVGGGRDFCIGAGEDWLANMDHRYGENYLERIQHEAESEHDKLNEWPPDCAICSFSEEVTQEQRRTADFIAAARLGWPEALEHIRALLAERDELRAKLARDDRVVVAARKPWTALATWLDQKFPDDSAPEVQNDLRALAAAVAEYDREAAP